MDTLLDGVEIHTLRDTITLTTEQGIFLSSGRVVSLIAKNGIRHRLVGFPNHARTPYGKMRYMNVVIERREKLTDKILSQKLTTGYAYTKEGAGLIYDLIRYAKNYAQAKGIKYNAIQAHMTFEDKMNLYRALGIPFLG